MEQLEITLDQVKFTVWGYYEKGCKSNDDFVPDDSPEFDIREVYQGDSDILDYLSDWTKNQLIEQVLRQLA